MTKTDKPTFLQSFTFPEWKVAAICALSIVLALVPYYNWFYRNFINWLSAVICFVSVLVVLFAFFRHITKFHFKRALFSLTIGVMIVGAGLSVQDWRYRLTDYIIQRNYCDLNEPVETDYLLGGIREIRVDNLPKRTGAFENSSSCLTVACVEEFYYCSEGKME